MQKVTLEQLMPLIEEAFSRSQTITIPVTGTSMRPTLSPKDAVTLERVAAGEIVRGDILLYRRKNGRFILHRAVKICDGYVDFCGDAQVEIESRVSVENVIARVCSYEKDGKTTDLIAIRKEGERRLKSRPLRSAATDWHHFRTKDMQRTNGKPVQFIAHYLKKRMMAIVGLCVLSAISAVAMLGMALASGRIIDKAMTPNEMHHFAEWFLLLFGLLILIVGCNLLSSNVRSSASARMKNEIRRELFAVLFKKQYSAVQKLHSGEILNRMTSDIQIVVDGAVSFVPQTVSLAIKLVGGFAFMMIVDPLFTSIVLVGGIVLSVLLQLFSRYYKCLHKECQQTDGKTRSYLQECVENLVVIKSFTNEKGVLEKLDEYQGENYKKQIRRNLIGSIGNTSVYFAFTMAYYAALAWGVLRIAEVFGPEAGMTVGTFATLLQIMEQIRSPFRAASGLLPQFYSMLASAERLQEFTFLPNESFEKLSRPVVDIYRSLERIRFNDVTFGYNSTNTVLEGTNAVFNRGELTVILGASGAGKSTLVKLLLGLSKPQNGSIMLETALGNLEVSAATRELFSFVPQGNMILSGTIAENIAFGNIACSREAIAQAASCACLDETLAMLPEGLDTVIGERGAGLSEGQLQRVAIARALLSEAPILLLDECTSALDASTEKRLITNLKALEDRTIVFISHREAVLQCADKVVRVDNKVITEEET